MYCKHCGKEVSDNAVICIHCGCSISKTSTDVSLSGESKSGLGALLGILLGLIGLIIGLLMFPTGSEERRTFIKGWGTPSPNAKWFWGILLIHLQVYFGQSCILCAKI